MIHCPGLATILPSALCPHTNLGFSLWPSFTAPAGLLSGNQPGRAHFSAHIILHIITNEYELPSVGHTRRKLGRERREGRGAWGEREAQCVTVLCWHINKLMHYSFTWKDGCDTHTRTFFSSNKVSTGNGSTAGKCAGEVVYPETLWTIKKLAFTEVNLQGPAKAIWSWDLLTYITKKTPKRQATWWIQKKLC